MGTPKLSTPRITVIREGFEPFEIQTDNRDLVRFDKTRPRQRPPWPDAQEAPILWMTFISWSAALRQGAIPPDLKFEAWEEQVLSLSPLDDDESEDGAAFPEGEPSPVDL